MSLLSKHPEALALLVIVPLLAIAGGRPQFDYRIQGAPARTLSLDCPTPFRDTFDRLLSDQRARLQTRRAIVTDRMEDARGRIQRRLESLCPKNR
jgi:hypothetical protein